MNLERVDAIVAKAIAVVFFVVGLTGLLAAVFGLTSAILDRLGSGGWHFVPFMQIPAFRTLPHPTFVQKLVVWVCSVPNFVLNASIGTGLLRIGVQRWIATDLPKSPMA